MTLKQKIEIRKLDIKRWRTWYKFIDKLDMFVITAGAIIIFILLIIFWR